MKQKFSRTLCTCFSSSLLTTERSEIGRYLEGEEEGGEDLGIGTMEKDFHSRGMRPVERERLKMMDKGREIEGEVALSIRVEIASGPVALLGSKVEMKEVTDCSEHRKDSGHLGGGEIGGIGFRGGAEELKHVAK